MKEQIFMQAMEVLIPVVVSLLGLVLMQVARWLRKKIKNEVLAGMAVRLNDSVYTAVKELGQTMVDELKEANKDGKLTQAEKDRLKYVALQKVKSYWGPKGLAELAKILGIGGGVDEFLSSKIEAAVVDVKAHQKNPS